MVGKFLRRYFYWLIFWGIAVQIFGSGMMNGGDCGLSSAIGSLFYLFGAIITVLGFSYYLESKKQPTFLSLLALVPIIGWVVIVLLENKNTN